MTLDLEQILSQVVEVAREVGEIHMRYFEQAFQVEYKSGAFDVVTEADKASEAYILAQLLPLFPTHHFVGEESGGQGCPIEEARYRWYIDPLDGTTNFATGIPHFCVSIALTDDQPRPLVGVVYSAVLNEMYTAIRGGGAFRNGQPIRAKHNDDLAQAVILTSIRSGRIAPTFDDLQHIQTMRQKVRTVRAYGAGALDLSWVAAGRVDAFFEQDQGMWDFMAGVLIAREAGAIASDYSGNDTKLFTGQEVLAASAPLHARVLAMLSK